MKLENSTLILDSQLQNEQINELVSQIVVHFDEIQKVEVENLDKGIASSALFSLLQSIKQRKNEIVIPLIDEHLNVPSMGKIFFVK